jgi:hypothetical protein
MGEEVESMLKTPAESAFAYAGIRHRLTELLVTTSDVGVDIMEGNLEGAGTAAWADDQVKRFAPMGLRKLSDAWNETSPRMEAMGGTFPPRAATQLVFDACTHEHDLRGAMGCPGARDTDSVVIGLTFIADSMLGLVEDRRLPGITLESPYFETTIGPHPAPVRVCASSFELFRAFAGRRSADQIHALPWQGDPGPYLELLDRGPLQAPSRPLIE